MSLSSRLALSATVASLFALGFACSGSTTKNNGTGTGTGTGLGDGGGTGFPGDDASTDTGSGLTIDGTVDGPPPATVSVIYAHTDDTLWKLDPTTENVTEVGAFTFSGGGGESITDLAVKGDGTVYVNSTKNLYSAAIPASGTGSVALTKIGPLGDGSSSFYALGFTPAGFLETGESLIAGDGNGDLYLVALPGGTTTKLGGFGSCQSGDPAPCGSSSGQYWALSGDVVFYNDTSGNARGLATLRVCTPSSGTPRCDDTNDVLAEIDMTALKSKSATANLRKQILGSGSGAGRLFGIGAWDANVYAFTRYSASKTTPESAQLIQIDGTGAGKPLKTFSTISSGPCAYDSAKTCSGWSGAGVTTKAKVTVVR